MLSLNVVWSLKDTADSRIYETQETYGKDLDDLLIYLSTFAPEFKDKTLKAVSVTCLDKVAN